MNIPLERYFQDLSNDYINALKFLKSQSQIKKEKSAVVKRLQIKVVKKNRSRFWLRFFRPCFLLVKTHSNIRTHDSGLELHFSFEPGHL